MFISLCFKMGQKKQEKPVLKIWEMKSKDKNELLRHKRAVQKAKNKTG